MSPSIDYIEKIEKQNEQITELDRKIHYINSELQRLFMQQDKINELYEKTIANTIHIATYKEELKGIQGEVSEIKSSIQAIELMLTAKTSEATGKSNILEKGFKVLPYLFFVSFCIALFIKDEKVVSLLLNKHL